MNDNALPPRGTALVLLLCAALLLLRLGQVPLVGPDEPRYARVAVEMQRAGEWVRPTLQGQPWLEKPPLYYWLAGAAFRLLGETEAAARLPAVGAMLLLVGVTALVGARLSGTGAGLHAAFVLATSPLAFAYARAASMDMLLAATVTAGLGLIALRLLGVAGRLAMPAAYGLLGLGVLAKGPLGVLLPGLVVLTYVVVTREWRHLRELCAPGALLAFALVGLPWYVAIWRDQGRHFVDVFLLDHNVARFTSTIHKHPGPLWYYLPVLLVGLFPWSGLLLPALAELRPRASRTDLFLLCWLLPTLAFFSLAGSKLPGYILPCLPPLALLCGRAAARLAERRAELAFWAGPGAVARVALALGALLFAGVFALRRSLASGWELALPAGVWALVVTFAASRTFARDASAGLRLLRVGAAGLLLLLTGAAPPLLARLESGRDLFRAAAGREVLAFGAWRTAWMSGYFYNDGKVREIRGLDELPAGSEPVLLLCGPGEARRVEHLGAFAALRLAAGPRGNVLLELRRRR